MSCLLSQDSETAPQELQLDPIDLQSGSVLKEKFSSLKLDEFYDSQSKAKAKSPNTRKLAQSTLVLFGSTYVCEQAFSVMIHPENCHNETDTWRWCTGKKRVTNNTVPTENKVFFALYGMAFTCILYSFTQTLYIHLMLAQPICQISKLIVAPEPKSLHAPGVTSG